MKSTAFFLIVTLVCLPEVTQAFIRKTRAFKSYNFARPPYKRAGSPFEDGVVVSSPANLQQIQQLNGRGYMTYNSFYCMICVFPGGVWCRGGCLAGWLSLWVVPACLPMPLCLSVVISTLPHVVSTTFKRLPIWVVFFSVSGIQAVSGMYVC